jgi:hypothetical protein
MPLSGSDRKIYRIFGVGLDDFGLWWTNDEDNNDQWFGPAGFRMYACDNRPNRRSTPELGVITTVVGKNRLCYTPTEERRRLTRLKLPGYICFVVDWNCGGGGSCMFATILLA